MKRLLITVALSFGAHLSAQAWSNHALASYRAFEPMPEVAQAPAVLAAMAGRDAMVVMATGSGKSLCYQAPALAMPGLTVVVSPLIALIADQHDRLRRAGMPVRMLTSLQGAEQQREALRDIRAGDVLLAHLGIWARKDPWAPAVLEPLITGLKARGLCFAPLREHPQFAQAARVEK